MACAKRVHGQAGNERNGMYKDQPGRTYRRIGHKPHDTLLDPTTSTGAIIILADALALGLVSEAQAVRRLPRGNVDTGGRERLMLRRAERLRLEGLVG